jgi:iron complex outermembrane receptor protein
VLNITSKQPTYRSENSAQLAFGQQGYVQGKAVLSGAFSDTAAGRIAVYKTHEDGYITNIHTGKKCRAATAMACVRKCCWNPMRTSACA